MPSLALLALVGGLRAEAEAAPRAAQFAAGEYTLFVEATRNVRKRKATTGNLTLRPATVEIGDGLSHPYYGWTDVDFRGLGAAIGANDVSPKSQDPENPGVLAATIPPGYGGLARFIGVPPSGGAVILLVATVTNRKETRLSRDGGGIGLVAQRWAGKCVAGNWVSWGVLHGAEGRFRLCPMTKPGL